MKPSTKIQHVRQAGRGSQRDLEKILEETVAPTAPTKLAAFAVAALPAAADYTHHVVYCTDGAAGGPTLAYSNGTNWKRADTGGNVATE